MNGFLLTLLAVTMADPKAAPGTDATQLTALVSAIRRADFRGDRAELRGLAERLAAVKATDLAGFRDYWRGFALWRSGINGGNETPMPADVRPDLEGAIEAFRGASKSSPDWIEPKIGLLFCWVGLAYAPGADASKPAGSREEWLAAVGEIREKGEQNPRALWFAGGSKLFAPAEHGGDPARAGETYRRGLQAARDEAQSNASAEVAAWVPAWGAAENLMSLAYLYTHGPQKDRGLALAYADGALALAPEWHYLGQILVPQIEALPAPPR